MIVRSLPSLSTSCITKLLQTQSKEIYKKCNLADFNIDVDQLCNLRLSYNHLPIDTYHSSQASSDAVAYPTRFRRYACLGMQIFPDRLLHITPKTDPVFTQDVMDARKHPRVFDAIQPHILEDILPIASHVMALVHLYEPHHTTYDVSVHQVRLLSYTGSTSDNAPEGMHQDGADYIVSAMVLNKHNIHNDTSIIYDEHRQPLYRTSLDEGEFLFQDDTQLWHDITPIYNQPGYVGYRDILGFDIVKTP